MLEVVTKRKPLTIPRVLVVVAAKIFLAVHPCVQQWCVSVDSATMGMVATLRRLLCSP